MSKLPLSPAAAYAVETIARRDWRPIASLALDPGTYAVDEEIALRVQGTVRVNPPRSQRDSVSYKRLASLALAKLSPTSRGAVAREYCDGREEPTKLARVVSTLGLGESLRDGSVSVKGYTALDLRAYLASRAEG